MKARVRSFRSAIWRKCYYSPSPHNSSPTCATENFSSGTRAGHFSFGGSCRKPSKDSIRWGRSFNLYPSDTDSNSCFTGDKWAALTTNWSTSTWCSVGNLDEDLCAQHITLQQRARLKTFPAALEVDILALDAVAGNPQWIQVQTPASHDTTEPHWPPIGAQVYT